MSAVARLLAGIGLNTDEFKRGIGEVSKSTTAAKKEFESLKSTIAAAFSVYAVVNFAKNMKNAAIEINRGAMEAGATTEGFQSLRKAMADAGYSADKTSTFLSKLQTSMIDALEGPGQMRKAFETLGISMDSLSGKSTDEVFGLISEKVVEAKGSTEAYGAIVDMFGTRMAARLLPTLRMVGEEGFGNLTTRMREAGVVMNEEFIARMIDIDTRIDSMGKNIVNTLIGVTDVIGAILTGLIEGFRNWASDESFGESFDRGLKAYVDSHYEAIEEIKAKQKEANANLTAGHNEVADAAEKAAARMAKAYADAADNATDAALAATNKQWEAIATAEQKYNKAIETARLDSMSSEEKLAEAISRRAEYLKIVESLETNRNKYTQEWYEKSTAILSLSAEIEKMQREMAKSSGDAGEKQRNESDLTRKFTSDQVTTLAGLQTLLKNMTDDELADFIAKITELHEKVGNLDFSGLLGLQALVGLKIPNESVQNAEQFGRALQEMAMAIGDADFSKLAGLEVLKGFSIPNESVMNARQFGRAITEMIEALNRKPLDLAPLQKVSDLFTALKGGEIAITIVPPTRDQLTLAVDESFKNDLSSLAGSAKTIASFKGTIYA